MMTHRDQLLDAPRSGAQIPDDQAPDRDDQAREFDAEMVVSGSLSEFDRLASAALAPTGSRATNRLKPPGKRGI